jgi:uncharacterized RDD family membrane protein YckC
MHWYYVEEGSQVGPLTKEEVEALVKEGKITAKTLVWHEGMTDWQEYGTIKAKSAPETSPAPAAVSAGPQEVCVECGRGFSQDEMIRFEDSWVCANCKPVFVQKLKEGMRVGGALEYAGFWIRFGAKFIDGIILWVINTVIGFLGGLLIMPNPEGAGFIGVQFVIMLLQICLGAAYTTWFLGRFGATLGKMACKIEVVRPDGGSISYARALGRHFAEWISGMILCIGYIMAAFDDEKRTLHDRICDTRVVRK